MFDRFFKNIMHFREILTCLLSLPAWFIYVFASFLSWYIPLCGVFGPWATATSICIDVLRYFTAECWHLPRIWAPTHQRYLKVKLFPGFVTSLGLTKRRHYLSVEFHFSHRNNFNGMLLNSCHCKIVKAFKITKKYFYWFYNCKMTFFKNCYAYKKI